MYIKFKDFTGSVNEGEVLLLSLEEMKANKEAIKGIPVCVTLTGTEPEDINENL